MTPSEQKLANLRAARDATQERLDLIRAKDATDLRRQEIVRAKATLAAQDRNIRNVAGGMARAAQRQDPERDARIAERMREPRLPRTAKQLAAQEGVSRQHIYRIAASGQVAARKGPERAPSSADGIGVPISRKMPSARLSRKSQDLGQLDLFVPTKSPDTENAG
ncbi:MAG: hypothetical protein K2Y04_10815 [Caulobacteraceae bacterium]|nr:hypothetical protein [Caulobacteraceae bacterium]